MVKNKQLRPRKFDVYFGENQTSFAQAKTVKSLRCFGKVEEHRGLARFYSFDRLQFVRGR
jgi:hypothetical protein